MGDRAIAEVKTEGGSLFVYTHNSGKELPDDARAAIFMAEDRWDDPPYATRIVVDQLTSRSRDEDDGHALMLAPDAEDEYNGGKPSVIIDILGRKLTTHRDGETTEASFEDVSAAVGG